MLPWHVGLRIPMETILRNIMQEFLIFYGMSMQVNKNSKNPIIMVPTKYYIVNVIYPYKKIDFIECRLFCSLSVA